jgi:hypothetical protein
VGGGGGGGVVGQVEVERRVQMGDAGVLLLGAIRPN